VCIVYMCVIVSSISSAGSSHIYAYLIGNDQDNGHKTDPSSGRTSQGNHNCHYQAQYLTRSGHEPQAEGERVEGEVWA
jgi:hypothetical protein